MSLERPMSAIRSTLYPLASGGTVHIVHVVAQRDLRVASDAIAMY
jgi:hypothetical protein